MWNPAASSLGILGQRGVDSDLAKLKADMTQPPTSLYQRMGGYDVIAAVIVGDAGRAEFLPLFERYHDDSGEGARQHAAASTGSAANLALSCSSPKL
jgi:hypothetical protein